ncbi:MAG: tetratricopeptide repeat protein, partial [Acidobacteriaceae bacterium]|nr:tetratricopeptide repeat protein [Acidobacteriaceae bacterium]
MAAPIVLRQDLMSSPGLSGEIANDESAAYQNGATEVLRTTVENRSGHMHAQAVITDLANQRNRKAIEVDGPPQSGLIGVLNEMAQRIDGRSTGFSTASDTALKAYVAGVTGRDSARQMQELDQAIAIDPHFGLAYLSQLQLLAASAPQQAQAVLANAVEHSSGFVALDQARLTAMRARLKNAPVAEQIHATEALLRLTPNDPDALLGLGSQLFLQGEAGTAESAFRKAIEFSPGNLNLRHQFAIGLIEAKQFRSAENVLSTLPENQNVITELAICVLLEGDAKRASSIYDRYLTAREAAKDPSVILLRANWLSVSEPLTQATSWLAGQKLPTPELQSLALSQLAIWEISEGRVEDARKNVETAAQRGASPLSKMYALAAGWTVSATRAISTAQLDDNTRSALSAYGLFLNRHYAEAAEVWRKLDQQSG